MQRSQGIEQGREEEDLHFAIIRKGFTERSCSALVKAGVTAQDDMMQDEAL
jgi:hypothetical protein